MSGITLEQFKRHAAKFGPECVLETARDYLPAGDLVQLELDIALVGRTGSRRRRTTATLERQVRELARRGVIRSAIADSLNISDRRVADILAKSRTSENGGHKPSVQAKLFAD